MPYRRYIFRFRRRADFLLLFNHLPECAIELLTKITANGVSRRRNYLQHAALYRRAAAVAIVATA